MDRPPRLSGRHAGIVLIVFGLTLGLGLVATLPGLVAPQPLAHSGSAPALPVGAARSVAPAPARVLTVHPSATPTAVTVHLNTGFGTYTILPATITINITVNNSAMYSWVNSTGVLFQNTFLWLNFTDTVTSKLCVSNNISGLITNATVPASATFYTEYLTFPITSAYFAGASTACPNIDKDTAQVGITAIVNGGPNGTAVGTAFQFGIYNPIFPPGWGVVPASGFVFATPTALLNFAPTPGQPQTYTMFANYSGQYIGNVKVSIFSPTTGALVFTASLRWNNTTVTKATWLETVPGFYPYTLSVFTTYGTFNTTGTLAIPSSPPTYYNSTSWSNTTFIPGLSSGGAGTLLLVVGLIVGMLVALVVGRLVWGGPKPTGPAQPWTQQKEGGPTNVCSVCGKSFTTPEELAAHSKSEHGMQ